MMDTQIFLMVIGILELYKHTSFSSENMIYTMHLKVLFWKFMLKLGKELVQHECRFSFFS